MLRVQLQPYLASGAPGWWAGNVSHRRCQFCVASGLSKELVNRRVVAAWGEFASRLNCQGQGIRFRERLRLSRPTDWAVRANGEGVANSLIAESSPSSSSQNNAAEIYREVGSGNQYMASIALPSVLPRALRLTQLSVVDQAFLLLGLIACTTSFALFVLIVTAIPTLNAMRKAAVSVEKLADIAREELPATMAAIRLSGMEISDLTLELNDLSQEISDGMRTSARAVQAAEVGIRRIGAAAASQTFAMLQETANVPVQVVRPAVVSAAATTLHAVSQAQKLVINLASSSYPRISGWLGQRGSPGKQAKAAAEVSSSAATLTELLTGEENPTGSLLSGASQLSLFDENGDDEGGVVPLPPATEN